MLISAAVFAAVVPLVYVQRNSWLNRFRAKLAARHAVSAPLRPHQESGWHLIHSDDSDSFNDWLGKDSHGLPFGEDEEPALGSHLLIELFGCDAESLKQESDVGTTMLRAAKDSEATIVAQSFHEFKPYGVSGAVIIQESHYTIHTWPEHGYAAVDLFYCGGTIRVDKAVDALREKFKPQRIKYLVVRRGIQHEVEHL